MNSFKPSRKVRCNRNFRLKPTALGMAYCFILNAAQANPIGAQVVSGTASINQSGNTLTVTNSPNAIINWQGFSINSGETTRFIQQSASSAILNRVLGADPSVLLGTLTSNGKVFLVNPAGILVGQGARIDVAGLVASTLNLSNEDFLAGKFNFGLTPNAGAIQNNGAITTPEGGTVYLVAPQIENNGIITTPRGETILAAGNTVQLVDTGTPGVTVQVTGSDNNATNLGQILADSGRIGMVAATLKNSGTLNASSMVSEGGRIFLRATQDAYVDKDGKIAATGTKGGSIEVLGNHVAVMDDAQLDASGQNGGGNVLVGGDYQGKNPAIQNSQITYFGSNAGIKADAIANGDGGKVIVWADDTTRAYGSISARGGAQGGNGGFVETSAKKYLAFNAAIDTSAPKGRVGTILLDPQDIIINNGTAAADDGLLPGSLGTANSTTDVNISEQALEGLSGNVTLQASRDIILNDLTDNQLNMANVGTGSTLTLTAGRHITTLDVNDRFLTGGGAISFTATGGNIDIGGVKTDGGAVTMNAGGTMTVREIVTTPVGPPYNGGSINLTSGGLMSLGGGNIDARQSGGGTNGNVTLNSGGAIVLQTGKTIYANQLEMTANGGITDGQGTPGPISTQVASLNDILNTGTGPIKISNTGNLTIEDIGTVGYGVKQQAANFGVSINTTPTNTLGVYAPVTTQNGPVVLSGPGGVTFVAYVPGTPPTGGGVFSNGGALTITAGDANASINMPADSLIDSGGGPVSLIADHMSFTSSSITAGAGTVTLNPYNAAVAIQLGSGATDAAATLGLTDVELNMVTAGTLRIGDISSGAIDIKSALVKTAGALEHISTALNLTSGGAITQQAGATIDALPGGLSLSGASVSMTQANPVGVISGSTSGGDFIYHSANKVTVSQVDSVSGITVPANYNVKLESDSSQGINQQPGNTISTSGGTGGLALVTVGPVYLPEANDIKNVAADLASNSGTGSFLLHSTNDLSVGSLLSVTGIATNNTDITLSTAAGKTLTVANPVSAGATGSVSLEADLLALSNSVTAGIVDIRPYTPGRNITVGSATCNASPCLNVTNLYKVVSPTVGIGTAYSGKEAGAIYVDAITVGGSTVSDRNTATTRIGLLTGAGITQGGAINVQDLGVVAGDNVLLDNTSNSLTNLSGKNTVAGKTLDFDSNSALNVIAMSGGTAPYDFSMTGISTSNGEINLTAPNISLGSTAAVTVTGGPVYLTATQSDGTVSQHAGGSVSAGNGLFITADNISFGGTMLGACQAGGGCVNIKPYTAGRAIEIAGASATAGKLSITQANLANINPAGSNINGGSIIIGDANSGAITFTGNFTSPGGMYPNLYGTTVSQSASTTINGGLHVVASGAITLTEPTNQITSLGFQFTSPSSINVKTSVASLSLLGTVSAGAGGLNIMNTYPAGGGIAVNNAQVSSTGNTTLSATGGITVNASTADAYIVGSPDVNLTLGGDFAFTASGGFKAYVSPAQPATTNLTFTNSTGKVLFNGSQATATTSGNMGFFFGGAPGVGTPAVVGSNLILSGGDASNFSALPTLSQCIANPALAGCTSVLPSLATCISAPTTSGCEVVLPSLATCTASPTTSGCEVVLPSLATCIAAPTTAGCTAVLPSLATCIAAPTTAGCTAVLPSLATCTAAPTTAGCTAVLPSLATCTAAPTTAGCTAVLPSLATCTAAPTTAGCTAVLPSLATCTAAPATAGCTAVLPSLATCTAAPATAGCTAVLPSLATCTAAPATAGCTAVLPSLATCTAAPTTAGCTAVLPSLATCTANPATAGCTAVLPSLATCTAAPTTAGCTAVLPSLATCTTAPATAGCTAVLPSLATCTANPATAGCTAVLPSLATCTANPATAGCTAVLPSLATCTTAPATAGCTAVLPSLATCTANPATAGCTAVLPSLATCTTAPATAGCTAVLPSLATCTTAPATAGCTAVLPSLATCTAVPTTAGCTAVLPSLATCTTAPATAGCTAVLPSLATCTANPATAGCTAVLPSLATCTTAPATAGCTAVLPSLATCTAVPTTAGCTAVLPSLATCTTAPATAGCTAVLPSLASCTATPTLSGCSVVLPSLASCTATPTLAGCAAVLPSLATCTAVPATAGCAAVLPPSSVQDTTQVVLQQTTVVPTPTITATTAPSTAVIASTAASTTTAGATGGNAVTTFGPAGGTVGGTADSFGGADTAASSGSVPAESGKGGDKASGNNGSAKKDDADKKEKDKKDKKDDTDKKDDGNAKDDKNKGKPSEKPGKC